MNETNWSLIFRWVFTLMGSVVAAFKPALPYYLICILMIFADCYTAWSLSRRARKEYPNKVSEDGSKFKSHHFGMVLNTMIKTMVLISLAFLMQQYIIPDSWPVDLAKIAAGAVCFWQLWSILENESSCNGSKWAKLMQKILVDKTSRHFDIDLSELKDESID